MESSSENLVLSPMRQAREVCLQVLYELDFLSPSEKRDFAAEVIERHVKEASLNEIQKKFVEKIASGVVKAGEELDVKIKKASPRWKMDRMGVLDRNILRMGAFELFNCPETGKEIAMNEAIELAKRFGEPDSSRFVNGLLEELLKSNTQ